MTIAKRPCSPKGLRAHMSSRESPTSKGVGEPRWGFLLGRGRRQLPSGSFTRAFTRSSSRILPHRGRPVGTMLDFGTAKFVCTDAHRRRRSGAFGRLTQSIAALALACRGLIFNPEQLRPRAAFARQLLSPIGTFREERMEPRRKPPP